jgi:hypothetical protein
MSLKDDPVFDALASLSPVTPDREWEVRVQTRCRSAITERIARRGRGKRYREGLAYLSAAAVLCLYMAAMFAQALRLAHF